MVTFYDRIENLYSQKLLRSSAENPSPFLLVPFHQFEEIYLLHQQPQYYESSLPEK